MQDDKQDWLDLLLIADAEHIDNAGFTEQVMRNLPRPYEVQRTFILLGALLLGGFFGLVILPGGQAYTAAIHTVTATLLRHTLIAIGTLGLLSAGIWNWYAPEME